MKNKLIGIYKITSPSGKIYIGKSTDIYKRWTGYKVKQNKKQTKLYNSFNKYGVLNHKFEIIELCDILNLSEKETFYIKKYNTYNTDNGLNLTGGGEGICFLSEDARKKIGEFHKGNKYNLGRITSDKTKEKLRKIGKLRIFTEEHKKRISESKKGTKHNKETIQKIKDARKKQISPMKGLKHSEETKLKIRQKKIGRKMPEEQRLKLIEYRTGKKFPRTMQSNKNTI